jgi:sucrose phosphorylase
MLLDKYFKNAIGGIHILPFFPSSGDRGFAPMDYHKVDPAFGDWRMWKLFQKIITSCLII